jgi:hypothetical protein
LCRSFDKFLEAPPCNNADRQVKTGNGVVRRQWQTRGIAPVL